MRPARSSSARGVNVTLVVALNAGAGNFWSSRLGTSQKFWKSSGSGTLKRRITPSAPDGNAHHRPIIQPTHRLKEHDAAIRALVLKVYEPELAGLRVHPSALMRPVNL